MAAVDSNVTPSSRGRFELVETIAVTDAAATATKNRALAVPSWAKSFLCIVNITITGTTPLFDFSIFGADVSVRTGATLDSTTDKFDFTGVPMTITQLTTDASSPIVTLACGPGVTLDVTGSATVNSSYAYPAFGLPTWLIYTYTYDGTTADEDYNGTISFVWSK